MRDRILITFLVAMLGSVGSAPANAATPSCAQLATNPAYGLAGNAKIVSPTSVLVPAADTHAAYCNVQFTYSAKSGTAGGYDVGQSQAIKIGIGLPLNSTDGGTGGTQGAWNGKLQNLGGGGCSGSVGATTPATDAGYVGSETDTGHTSAENGSFCNFGVIQAAHTLNLGKINDFIYEGVHQQVEWAKSLSKGYYGVSATRNYWNGCSTGGRQGLALAQTHGDEFDGFVIGAPAVYWQQFRLSDSWPALVVRDKLTAKGKLLSDGQFAAATSSAVAACDVHGTDTVSDGLIDDPRACTFSAKANICGMSGAPAAPNCLDADQASAIDMIWDGPRNRLGKRIWHPNDRGIALTNSGFGSMPSSTGQVVAYDHRDLTFSANNVYLDKAAIAAAGNPANAISYEDEATLGARNTADLMDTQNPDLRAVKNRGGKIIMWQGASDPAIRWRDSVDYYRRVAVFFGNGEANFTGLQSWFRYYHAPGVAHCGGGAGPSPATTLSNHNTQLFDDLVNWVEHGMVPNSAGPSTNGGILATGGTANPSRTRPICPWPTTAIYNGSGSTDVAANFHCGGNLDKDPIAVCNMLRTKYKHENEGALNTDETDLDGRDVRCQRDTDDHGHGHDGDDREAKNER